MIKINVLTTNIGWRRYIKNPSNFIDKKINIYNKKNKKFKKNIIFCTLMLSGNQEIKKLNQKFRKKNKSTDVLSFPFYDQKKLKKELNSEKEIYLGDIIINFHKVKGKKNLNFFKLNFDKLWIHGFTHLFGYVHKQEKDFRKMHRIEKDYLKYIK